MASVYIHEVNGSEDTVPATSTSKISDLKVVFISEPLFPPQVETPVEATSPTFLSSDPIAGYCSITGIDPQSSDWSTARVKVHLQGI